MGANESTLRTAATLIVLDRRNILSSSQLYYINTDEFNKFFTSNGDKIKEKACDLYGFELIKLIEQNRVSPLQPIVEDIYKHGCKNYRAPNIYTAVKMMIESKNSGYDSFYSKLAGYITFDSIIYAIYSGSKTLYDIFKEPVARIPGKSGVLDPVRNPLNRGKVLTLTDMNKEELGLFAIFVALISISINPTSQTQLYLLRDVIEYVQQIKLLSKREVYNAFNDMLNLMEKGGLYTWSPKLYEDVVKYYNIPIAEPSAQRKAYKVVNPLREIYPRIGFFG